MSNCGCASVQRGVAEPLLSNSNDKRASVLFIEKKEALKWQTTTEEHIQPKWDNELHNCHFGCILKIKIAEMS